MASAQFSVNGTVPTTPVTVSPGATVALALTNVSGVDGPRGITWSIYGSHAHDATLPSLTPTGSPPGVTATLVMPNQADQAFGVKCVVAGGKDASGRNDPNLTAKAIIGCVNVNGYLPFIVGEELERQATHGYTELLNELLRRPSGGTGTGLVSYWDIYPSNASSNTTRDLSDDESSTDHEAGVYLVTACARVYAAATTGSVKAVIITDEGEIDGWAPQDITTTGQLTFPGLGVHSNGTAPLQVRYEYTGVTGSPSVDLRPTAILMHQDPAL